MNKKYLEDDNFRKAYKKFIKLNEWSFVPSGLDEDEGDDVENQEEGMPQDNNMGGEPQGDMGGAPQGGMGEDPNAMPQDDNMGGGMPQGEEPMPQGGGMGDGPNGMPQGDEPMPQGQDNMMGGEPDMPPMGDEETEDDEELIDVDKLTDAQEKLNKKTNAVGRNLMDTDNKIEKLVQLISKASEMIDANNKSIEDLRNELEMRNPTNQEKMNLRSLSSTPFTVDPRKFWTGKANENPHYAPYSDNDEGTEYGKRGNEQYTISSDEIKNTNDREIADTFVVPDEFKMDLHKILGF